MVELQAELRTKTFEITHINVSTDTHTHTHTHTQRERERVRERKKERKKEIPHVILRPDSMCTCVYVYVCVCVCMCVCDCRSSWQRRKHYYNVVTYRTICCKRSYRSDKDTHT